jgi:hypothetical protein
MHHFQMLIIVALRLIQHAVVSAPVQMRKVINHVGPVRIHWTVLSVRNPVLNAVQMMQMHVKQLPVIPVQKLLLFLAFVERRAEHSAIRIFVRISYSVKRVFVVMALCL